MNYSEYIFLLNDLVAQRHIANKLLLSGFKSNKLIYRNCDACNLCIMHFKFKQVQVTLAKSDGTVVLINVLKQGLHKLQLNS